MSNTVPNYLKDYKELYLKDPHAANLQWFKNAKYGLFLHYGLYSILGRHEWVQLREKISVAQYALLKDQFTAEKFDADAIVSFAIDCGMKYINLTTRHHDSFCLWNSKETDFNSMNSPAKRDLVGELAAACNKQGIGLFLYYSHGRDWKHPHAPNNDQFGGKARPDYEPPEPSYKYGKEHDLNIYLEFMKNQVAELLTNYPGIAGIWLDGITVPMNGDTSKFKCQELYDHIRKLKPHALVSYKQGLLGTEDFFTPEHYIPSETEDEKKVGKISDKPEKPIEVNSTMTFTGKGDGVAWGYYKGARHKTEEEVWEQLKGARRRNANLLLNTGPLPDGSIDPEDEKTMRAVGERIRKEGFPG